MIRKTCAGTGYDVRYWIHVEVNVKIQKNSAKPARSTLKSINGINNLPGVTYEMRIKYYRCLKIMVNVLSV